MRRSLVLNIRLAEFVPEARGEALTAPAPVAHALASQPLDAGRRHIEHGRDDSSRWFRGPAAPGRGTTCAPTV